MSPGAVSGQLSTTPAWSSGPAVLVSCGLSTHRHSLLGHPLPARELGLPYGRPNSLAGNGCPRSECRWVERPQETSTAGPLLQAEVVDNWPDTAPGDIEFCCRGVAAKAG